MKWKTLLLALLLALMPLSSLAAGEVDINSADAGALADAIKGVGPVKAAAIVAWRAQNGPFASVNDLSQVKGIDQKIIEANRSRLTTGKSR